MIKLEPLTPHIPLCRAWTIFFSDGDPGIWKYFTRKGFRHVEAAAYFSDQDRWVFVMPRRARLVIEVKRPEEAGPFFAGMMQNSTVALRFYGKQERIYAPALTGCVGTIKALTGIQSRALWPSALYDDLLRQGAEIIHVDVQPRYAAGRPRRAAFEGSGAAAGGAGPDTRDAGAAIA